MVECSLPHYPTSRSGVPIIKNEKIDDDAEFLISQFDPTYLSNPRPMDIEGFAERLLGLSIYYNNLSHNGCIWGRMVFNNRQIPVYDLETNEAKYCPVDRDTIMIDNSLLEDKMEHSFRFTIGHEAGHRVYHGQIYYESGGQMTLTGFPPASTACRSVDIQGNSSNHGLADDHNWIEHHANYFSAAVLMPKSAMEIVCNDPEIIKMGREEFPTEKASSFAVVVADVFNVSPQSAQIRIDKLKLGPEHQKNRMRQMVLFCNEDKQAAI